jgi:hypothetical protein
LIVLTIFFTDIGEKRGDGNNSIGIPFDYRDLYGKLPFLTGNGSKLNFFGFNYTDGVDFPITDFSWNSNGGGMDFTLIPTNSNTIVNGLLAFSGYTSMIEEADRQPRSSSISGYYGALNLVNYGKDNEVRYGLELNGFRTQFQFVNFRGYLIDQDERDCPRSAAMSSGSAKLVRSSLSRASGFDITITQRCFSGASFGSEIQCNRQTPLQGSRGLIFTKSALYHKRKRYCKPLCGLPCGPEEQIYKLGGTEPTSHRLPESAHAVAGFEIDVTKNLDLNIEGYNVRAAYRTQQE